jgi:hypothetical protein
MRKCVIHAADPSKGTTNWPELLLGLDIAQLQRGADKETPTRPMTFYGNGREMEMK